MERRSRRDIELSRDIKHLTIRRDRKQPRPLSDDELARLADKFGKNNNTRQGE